MAGECSGKRARDVRFVELFAVPVSRLVFAIIRETRKSVADAHRAAVRPALRRPTDLTNGEADATLFNELCYERELRDGTDCRGT
jgi:hypothetical protein